MRCRDGRVVELSWVLNGVDELVNLCVDDEAMEISCVDGKELERPFADDNEEWEGSCVDDVEERESLCADDGGLVGLGVGHAATLVLELERDGACGHRALPPHRQAHPLGHHLLLVTD